jgi:hypothetical protein
MLWISGYLPRLQSAYDRTHRTASHIPRAISLLDSKAGNSRTSRPKARRFFHHRIGGTVPGGRCQSPRSLSELRPARPVTTPDRGKWDDSSAYTPPDIVAIDAVSARPW